MDDFLWDCVFMDDISSSSNRNRLDIIPNYEEDVYHFNQQDNYHSTTTILNTFIKHQYQPKNYHNTNDHSIFINILEAKEHGVLDIIGGELWEGALLLCSYLLHHIDQFISCNVLELGSGVGLPSLLLIKLKSLMNKNIANDNIKSYVILSDNDTEVVNNLYTNVKQQFDANDNNNDDMNESNEYNQLIGIELLDWSIFTKKPTTTTTTIIQQPQEQPYDITSILHHITPDIIIGCELCYAPYHAQCLMKLIAYYLTYTSCKEIVILQMKDREGFHELLSLLSFTKYTYDIVVHDIPKDIYDTAQLIEKSIIPIDITQPITIHEDHMNINNNSDTNNLNIDKSDTNININICDINNNSDTNINIHNSDINNSDTNIHNSNNNNILHHNNDNSKVPLINNNTNSRNISNLVNTTTYHFPLPILLENITTNNSNTSRTNIFNNMFDR